MRRRIFVACLGSVLAFAPVGWTKISAQQSQGQEQVTSSPPEAGYLFFSGGGVRGKRVRTQSSASQIGSPGAWVTIPGAILAWTVPTGTADLFNVAFSSECTKVLGGSTRIRVIDTVSGTIVALEPYDANQVFCSSASPATYKGNWARRFGAGTHTLQVQVNNTAGFVLLDDWTFELVVYD